MNDNNKLQILLNEIARFEDIVDIHLLIRNLGKKSYEHGDNFGKVINRLKIVSDTYVPNDSLNPTFINSSTTWDNTENRERFSQLHSIYNSSSFSNVKEKHKYGVLLPPLNTISSDDLPF